MTSKALSQNGNVLHGDRWVQKTNTGDKRSKVPSTCAVSLGSKHIARRFAVQGVPILDGTGGICRWHRDWVRCSSPVSSSIWAHIGLRSCQIYRPDQRSKKPSQYLLADGADAKSPCTRIFSECFGFGDMQDPSGTSANCGIELQVVEGAGQASRADMADYFQQEVSHAASLFPTVQASPNKAKAHVGGGLEPGTRVVLALCISHRCARCCKILEF